MSRPYSLLLLGVLALALAGCASQGNARDAAPSSEGLARQVLVTLPLGDVSKAQSQAELLARDADLVIVGQWRLRSLGLFCVVYRIPDGETVSGTVTRLAADPRVHSAQPMQTFRTLAGEEADPYLHLQHALRVLRGERAHQVTRGRGVSVAVVDTGVDLGHPDLSGQVDNARNFVDRAGERFTGDRHGTGVAGVIAAGADNGIGIAGVAPESDLWVLKACWREDDVGVCSSFTLAKALDFAIRGQVDVINMSLAGPRDPVLEALVRVAGQHGIVLVAAGGDGSARQPFPAAAAGVIAVRVAGAHAPASHAGIPAPGSNVLTTVPDGTYDMLSGSSLAAAHVSGAVALMRSLRPGLSPAETGAILGRSLRTVADADGSEYQVLDLCAALDSLGAEHRCPSGGPHP